MNSAWAQSSAQTLGKGIDHSAWEAIAGASPVVQITLFILVLMSVICWGIFFDKRRQFRRMIQSNQPFYDIFCKAPSFDEISQHVKDHPQSSFARVFQAGYVELQRIADSRLLSNEGKDSSQLTGIENLERALQQSIQQELARLESRLTFLATTGSTGPFIGLFGTVWGIMGAFQKIGQTGAAHLAVVAPGISEALIATAVGLAAAIPAVIVYNGFINKIRRHEIELGSFTTEMLNIAKRNFFKD